MTKRILQAVALGALAGAMNASAQPYKCTGEDGKIVYSDVRCEGPAAKPPAKPGAAGEAAKGRGYELTTADRDRIRDLEALWAKAGTNSEQKTAAQFEIQNIRRGAEGRLSATDREKREALVAELASADAKKRTQAMRDLRELYSR